MNIFVNLNIYLQSQVYKQYIGTKQGKKNTKRKRKRAMLITVLTLYQWPRWKSTQWSFHFETDSKFFRQREILSGAELLNTWNWGINHTQFYLFSSHCLQPSSVKSTIPHPIGKSIAFWLLLAIRIDQSSISISLYQSYDSLVPS